MKKHFEKDKDGFVIPEKPIFKIKKIKPPENKPQILLLTEALRNINPFRDSPLYNIST